MEDIEIELTGGNSNESVVRVGDTVRRPIRHSSATVHRLLGYLQRAGFNGSPVFLGIDEKGREILTFIPGQCEISSSTWRSTGIVESVALRLREMHDITAQLPQCPEDQWSYVYPDYSQHEVICHNDFGLYNLVIDQDQCVGVIDFDLAGPGPRLRDIAYAAYWLVPLSQRAHDMKPFAITDIKSGCRRLKHFCSSYGVTADAALLDMVSEVLHHMASEQAMMQLHGADTVARLKRAGHLDHWLEEALAFDRSRLSIEQSW